jgi:hypothetical protein
MSTLATAVQARIPATRLVQLTNINDDSATTTNTTILEYAVDDTTADFKTYAMVVFDSSDARHIRLGIDGVLAFLEANRGQDADQKRLAAWRDRCAEFAKTTSRARVSPLVAPGLPPVSTPNARPTFDPTRFADGQPAFPPSGSREDD